MDWGDGKMTLWVAISPAACFQAVAVGVGSAFLRSRLRLRLSLFFHLALYVGDDRESRLVQAHRHLQLFGRMY